jgi:RHS repeat-associated protein
MAVPVETRSEATPGGKKRTVTRSRTATLSNPGDPLSVTLLDELVQINGRSYKRSFDVATRVRTVTTPEGRKLTEKLDTLGRVVERQLGGLEPVFMSYDALGRLAMTTLGNRIWTRSYDAAGQLEKLTDPLGRTTTLSRDLATRITGVIRPDSALTSMSYDGRDNLVALTPPAKPAHTMDYTPVDLLSKYTPPLVAAAAEPLSMAYNLDRQLDLVTRADGASIDYGYDSAGRVSSVLADGETKTYAYDPGTGRLTSITGPGSQGLAFTYDGHLMKSATWSGPVAGSVELGYDDDFRVAQESVNGLNPIALAYDGDSLLTNAGDVILTRDAQTGLVTSTSLGQTSEAYSYNTFGELTNYIASFAGSPLYSVTYTRDALGRITKRVETIQGATHTTEYGYDLAGRLSAVFEDGLLATAYDYDANGNRLKRTTATAVDVGSYDAQDRILSYGSFTFLHNAHGDLEEMKDTLTGATTSYLYDPHGALRQVMVPDGRFIEYLVDGQDRRIGKKVNGVLERGWLYIDGLRPAAELDGAGNVVARFVYAGRVNVPAYMIKGGAVYRVFHDHLGSARLIVDAVTGAIAQRLDYDEFGRVLLDTNPGFQPFGFAGGLYDSDTRLIRFGARDYDPVTGRWTARDPLGIDSVDANLYLYAVGDPISFMDADGRVPAIVPVAINIAVDVLAAAGAFYSANKAAQFVRCAERYAGCIQESQDEERCRGYRDPVRTTRGQCDDCLARCVANAGKWYMLWDPWPSDCP